MATGVIGEQVDSEHREPKLDQRLERNSNVLELEEAYPKTEINTSMRV